jgi:hypothetical protein
MKTVIKLKSDNFDCLVTPEAYNEIRLQMSTGDFGTHTHEYIRVESSKRVYTLEDYVNDTECVKCPTCGRF